jgi:putative peptidoglycan lipid II flippase
MSGRVGVAALLWGLSILLSRVIGVVREAVIGRVLGGGAEADVYWTSFVLPDYLNYLLAGGALSVVFIPIFAGHVARGDEAEGWRVFSTIFNFVSVALIGVTVVLWALTPALAPLVAPGFEPWQHELLVKLTRITLPAQIFHVLGGLFSAVLQARDKHALPAFANLGYSLSIVGFGLVLGPSLGAEGFAWGVLVGSILGPFGMPLYGCLQDGLGWRPLMRLGHPDFRRYVWLSFPIMVAFSIVVVDDWLLKRFGSLVGEGVVSRLQYAKTLMKVPWGIFGMAAGAAAFPTLARLVAEGKGGEAYVTLIRACRVMLVLAFASQAAFTVAGEHLAAVIWGTTRFTAAELQEIGLLNAVFCGALGAWAAQSLISRGFYAQQNTWFPSLWGSAVVLLAWPLYGLLGERLGAVGLAIASSIAITVYTVVMSLRLRQTLAGPDAPTLVGFVLKMLGITALGVLGGEALDQGVGALIGPEGLAGPTSRALVRGALGGGLAMILCLGLAWVFGVNEAVEVVRRVQDALARRLGARLPFFRRKS